MKTIRSYAGGLCLLAVLIPASVFAAQGDGPKAKLMAKYDTNKNGVIDGDEIAAVRAAFAAAPEGELKRFDKNHDGKLDDAEIAAIKGPGGGKGKKEKKAQDADPTTTANAPKEAPKPDTPAPKDAGK